MVAVRKSGVLLHPTCFPGPYGIGDLGPEAYRFADFLHDAGQRIWQLLPLGPTSYGDSPYQGFSAFAGNPLLISPDKMLEEGRCTPGDLSNRPSFPDNHVDFGAVIAWKRDLLRRVHARFSKEAPPDEREAFQAFCQTQAPWLDDFALFMALKERRDYAVWTLWEPGLALHEPGALEAARTELADEIEALKFTQYEFFFQWASLRRYCHSLDIQIIGDIPIYVAHDSVDVWAHREVFQLDDHGDPLVVAGVPPDYFSETGQLWGNPIYRWDRLAETGFAWWVDRVRATLDLVDVVRLDHFRGFQAYWEVPHGAETAAVGRWVEGPGAHLFEALAEILGPDLPIIAENLGVITPEVEALRRQFAFPGMAVLQFGYGHDAGSSDFPLHAYTNDLVAYTGTHDNDTLLGWWNQLGADRASQPIRAYIRKYLATSGRGFHWACIRAMAASVADIVVFPLQDVLGLGNEARMNLPGSNTGNWTWRCPAGAWQPAHARRLRELMETYGRLEEA